MDQELNESFATMFKRHEDEMAKIHSRALLRLAPLCFALLACVTVLIVAAWRYGVATSVIDRLEALEAIVLPPEIEEARTVEFLEPVREPVSGEGVVR